MKKNGILATICLFVLVLGLSFLCTQLILPMLGNKSYSGTSCLNDQITEDMDIYDVAKLYRDSQATVHVEIFGNNMETNQREGYIGSGVCIASKGYTIDSLSTPMEANKGSYIVTNYHVIDIYYDDMYTNFYISITTEDNKEYACTPIWYDKNLDLAVLYSANANLNYVRMVDRSINCAKEQKLDYEPIFTIGTPIEPQYLNRLTVGNIASNNSILMLTADVVIPNPNIGEYVVLSNIYEDVIDVSLGISPGNSGGGCFDANGSLVGLTTLASNVENTNGNQINGVVPIYPVMNVIDRLIANNEMNGNYKILSLDNLGLVGFDKIEAEYVTLFKKAYEMENLKTQPYYYFNGTNYDSSYANDFSFSDEGFKVLTTNANKLNLKRGDVIKYCQINDEKEIIISDRNDLIYALTQVTDGDTLNVRYQGILGSLQTNTIQF